MTQAPSTLLLSDPPPRPAVIALSEGHDPRVVAGALAAQKAGIAHVGLVGPGDAVRAALRDQGGREGEDEGVTVHDPAASPHLEAFAQAFHTLRRHKGVDEAAARAAVRTPLIYAAMLVREGHADGTLGGAVATTADVVRTAIQVIGMAPDAGMVSSCSLLLPPQGAGGDARAMIYADCGLVIEPSAADLVTIAAAAAQSCRALLRLEPRIAMLSFSTKGSAQHSFAEKSAQAAAMLKERHPDLHVDGELQFDAAFAPDIAARKSPDSTVAGCANVMVFPDLGAANIGYKITERLGGYSAIGPVLQGLRRPANDLSRGCAARDVTEMIAVTALQALEKS